LKLASDPIHKAILVCLVRDRNAAEVDGDVLLRRTRYRLICLTSRLTLEPDDRRDARF
jgi:hypothetical protein